MTTITNNTEKEIRLKKTSVLLGYIKQFSATERAIFSILSILAIITALVLAKNATEMFMVEVPTEGGTLVEGIVGLPRTINPVIASTDADKDLTSLVYSGLMRYKDGKIVTDLASSYKVSEDGLTYTFNLKDDLKFQDGEPLTSEDIAFTIQKIQDPTIKSPKRSDWINVGVKIDSSKQIEFTLKQPYSPFISNTTIGILPKHIWGSVSNDQFIFSQYNIDPIGSGPYKVTNITRDSGGIPTDYTLSTWRNFYDRKPYISEIIFKFYGDQEKALSALDGGYIDSLSSVSSSDANTLSKNLGESYDIKTSPLPRIFGLYFNQNQNPVLADSAVRKALDISVDRDDIVSNQLNGYGVAIHNALTLNISTSTRYSGKPDMQRAIDILEKGGWKKNSEGIFEKTVKTTKNTLSFDIYTADTPELKNIAESLKKYWNEVGIDINIKVFEQSDLYQNVIRTRKYDALLFGEFIGKDGDLYAFWHSSQRNYPGLNISMYTNSTVDKILEDLRSIKDEKDKQKKYNAFYSEIEKDTPAIFLYVPDFIYSVPKSVKGVNLSNITVPSDRWNTISDWYIDTEKVWKYLSDKL